MSLLAVAATIVVLERGYWAFFNWPVFKFKAACEEVAPDPGSYISRIQFLDGELSGEFWRIATSSIQDYTHWIVTRDQRVISKQGKVFLTLSEFYHLDVPGRSTPDKRKIWFQWVSSEIGAQILERRKQEGHFTEKDQQTYLVFRKRWNMKQPMLSGECGFLEELILKGGRFASE